MGYVQWVSDKIDETRAVPTNPWFLFRLMGFSLLIRLLFAPEQEDSR